jgi:hypothetical protein
MILSGKILKVLVDKTPSYEFTLNRTEINQNFQSAYLREYLPILCFQSQA